MGTFIQKAICVADNFLLILLLLQIFVLEYETFLSTQALLLLDSVGKTASYVCGISLLP